MTLALLYEASGNRPRKILISVEVTADTTIVDLATQLIEEANGNDAMPAVFDKVAIKKAVEEYFGETLASACVRWDATMEEDETQTDWFLFTWDESDVPTLL